MNDSEPVASAHADAGCLLCGQPLGDADVRSRYETNVGSYERMLRDQIEERIRTELEAAEAVHAAQRLASAEQRLQKGYDRRLAQVHRANRSLQTQLEGYKRRLDQLTPEARGTLREDEILEVLRQAFPADRIERVKRGSAGRGDILHEVVSGNQRSAGTIVYECKDVARWNKSFVAQALSARDRHPATHAVLISSTVPGEDRFCMIDGVATIGPEAVLPLVQILRASMLELARRTGSQGDREARGRAVFEYLQSSEFRCSFEAVMVGLANAQAAVVKERREHELTWSRREALYRRIEGNVLQIKGSVIEVLDGVAAAPDETQVEVAASVALPLAPVEVRAS